MNKEVTDLIAQVDKLLADIKAIKQQIQALREKEGSK